MSIRRLIYYLILTGFEFIINAFLILYFVRNTYNYPDSNPTEYRDYHYWIIRIVIVVFNIIIAFKLVPNTSKRYRFLLGLISGTGFLLFSFFTHEIFNSKIIEAGNTAMMAYIISIYLMQISCLEIAIRIKLKLQTKQNELQIKSYYNR
ncbi:MAG: hypothetical protein ACOYO1_17700 [Bacteroidales bacterium]